MIAPRLYRDELALQGGNNPLGEPNFLLWWGERPMHGRLLAPGLTCWCLLEWHPAEDAGSPATWPYRDLGPYPSRGFYDILQVFRRGPEPSRLDTAELNLNVLRHMVCVAKQIKEHSLAQRQRKFMELRDQKSAEQRQHIADALEDSMPSFGESASYSGQRTTKTVLAQKMEQIEKNLPHSDEFARRMPRRASIAPSTDGA